MSTFRLLSREDERGAKRMIVAVELKEGSADDYDAAEVGRTLFEALAKVNKDFYNALYNTATEDTHAELSIHEYGSGPFHGGGRKLKHQYVETDLEYDDL